MLKKTHKSPSDDLLKIKVDFYNGLINDFAKLLKTNTELFDKFSFLEVIDRLINKINTYQNVANKNDLLYSSSYFLLILSTLLDLKLGILLKKYQKKEILETLLTDQEDILINLKEHQLILQITKFLKDRYQKRSLSYDRLANYKFFKQNVKVEHVKIKVIEDIYLNLQKNYEQQQPLIKDDVNFIDIQEIKNHFNNFLIQNDVNSFFLKKHLYQHNMRTKDHLALSFFILLFLANDAMIKCINQPNFEDLKIIKNG